MKVLLTTLASLSILLVNYSTIHAALPSLQADYPVNSWQYSDDLRYWNDISLKQSQPTIDPAYLEYAKRGETYTIGQFITPAIFGNSFAARVTGDPVYIDNIARTLDYLSVSLKDRDKDGYREFQYSHGNLLFDESDSSISDEIKAHAGIALGVYALQENTPFKPELKVKVDFWKTYLEQDFLGKWQSRAGGLDNTFVTNYTESYQASVNFFLYMYRLTGKQEYLAQADKRAGEISRGFVCDSNTCVWGEKVSEDSAQTCQPIMPASNTILYMAELNAQGYSFYSDAVMEHIAGSLKSYIIPDSDASSADSLCGTQNISGLRYTAKKAKWSSKRIFGYGPWVLLSKWDTTTTTQEFTLQMYNQTSENDYFPNFALFSVPNQRKTNGLSEGIDTNPQIADDTNCQTFTTLPSETKLLGQAQGCNKRGELFRLIVTVPSGTTSTISQYTQGSSLPIDVTLNSENGVTSVDIFHNTKFLARLSTTKPVENINAEQNIIQQRNQNVTCGGIGTISTPLGCIPYGNIKDLSIFISIRLAAFVGLVIAVRFIYNRWKKRRYKTSIASPNE